MLIVFTNKSGGTVEMFEKVALDFIKMMGKRPTVPSAISAEDLPKALDDLQTGIKQMEPAITNDDGEEDEDAPKPIGLSTRAYPLIELMKSAINDKSFLMWDYN